MKFIAVPAYILVPADKIELDGTHFNEAASWVSGRLGRNVIVPAPGELADWEYGTRTELETKLDR
jgi:hypothetical protein